jgi:hypothetical protein
VVGAFFLLHVAVTGAFVWATLSATIAWRKSTVPRRTIEGIILLVGVIASALASTSAVFFCSGVAF